MNCFMGYNPLATKQVKVTVWVCEQDGATPVAPSNPSAGDCFIVYATDEAVLSNTPTSAKTYADGEWKDAEGGGGGETIFPTFTIGEDYPTCDMTYAEVKEIWTEQKGADGAVPCHLASMGGTVWSTCSLVSGEALLDYKDVPETVTEGFYMPEVGMFAEDGNFYQENMG